jgi:hypothetical protein
MTKDFFNKGRYDNMNMNTADGFDDDFDYDNLDENDDDENTENDSYDKSDSIANIEPSLNSLNAYSALLMNKNNSINSAQVSTTKFKQSDIKQLVSAKSSNEATCSSSGAAAPTLADAVNAFRTIKAFLQNKISTIQSTLDNLNNAEQVVVETFGENNFDVAGFFANK